MKPTLNEEIGMSQQGIDYVNSLEVKHETIVCALKLIKEDNKKELEQQRIRKQARNSWICIAVILILTLILNWK